MKSEELLEQLKEIRKGLEHMNKMISLLVYDRYGSEEEDVGKQELDIKDVKPTKDNFKRPSYFG